MGGITGRSVRYMSVGVLALALSACGGSGGGPRPEPIPPPPAAPPAPPPPPPAPPPPPPPSGIANINYADAEYQRSNGAVSSGAIQAWRAGGRGQNVTVGVVDSGINAALPEFAGRIHPASQDVAASRGVTDSEGHGTAVSGVIAANRDGAGSLGVAFESRILSLNTANPASCDPEDGCSHSDRDIGRAIDIARANGARVINVSLGGDGVGSFVLGAVSRAAAAGIVVVISAGNDGALDPSRFALDTARNAGGGHVIIAGAVDEQGALASFSNRAGAGAAHYLAALGVRVRTVDENGTATLWSGTSFSAPVVSGAAALLASAFPNLTGRQIVDLLLTTADDAGAAGRDSDYGNGILNIGRAFQPQGNVALAGSSTPLDALGAGQASGPMGDAEGEMDGVIILDGYSRAFAVDLAGRLRRAPRETPLADGLQPGLSTAALGARGTMVSVTVRHDLRGQADVGLAQAGMTRENAQAARAVAGHVISRLSPRSAVALGFSESGSRLARRLSGLSGSPFLVARDADDRLGFSARSDLAVGARHDLGPVALTVTSERGRADSGLDRDDQSYSLSSLSVDRRLGRANLSLGVSRLEEESTLLGGRFAFAPAGSTSLFLDAGLGFDLGAGWSGHARYRRGWTRMPGGAALVTGGRLSTDAWSLDLSRSDALTDGDHFALRIAQPLRVVLGGYALRLPVSYDYASRSAGFSDRLFDLAPRGREIDLEAAYGIGLFGGAFYLGANAFLRHQPGHFADAPDDIGAAARFSLRF